MSRSYFGSSLCPPTSVCVMSICLCPSLPFVLILSFAMHTVHRYNHISLSVSTRTHGPIGNYDEERTIQSDGVMMRAAAASCRCPFARGGCVRRVWPAHGNVIVVSCSHTKLQHTRTHPNIYAFVRVERACVRVVFAKCVQLCGHIR